jgi:hypothetical protein
MKKNEERILKYFSDLLNEKEKTQFENELKFSEELNNEFLLMKEQIDSLKFGNGISVDERYFANLLPRVRNRMEKKNFTFYSKKIYYIAPTLTAIAVLLLFFMKPSAVIENQYNTLANEVVNNISDKEVSQKYLYEIEGDPASVELSFNNENINSDITSGTDLNHKELISLMEKNYSDDYSTLNKLSDKELEVIANNLNMIKIK